MMSDSLRCVLILMIYLHSGLSSVSGTVNVSRSCCQGDTIKLFENITFNSSGPVNLYLNGIRQTLIVTWESNQNPSVLPGYKETLFQDEYGTLWIRNIQLSHEGKYVLSYKINNSLEQSEVQVVVMVAPTKECKPKIKKTDIFLIASLEPSECGRPEAHVEWRNQSDISIIEKKFLKLSPENKIGTYSACAETPAMTCVKTFKISYYCSTFTVEGDIDLPVSSEMSDTRIHTIIMIIAIVALAIVLTVTVVYIISKRRRKNRLKSRLRDRKENDERQPFPIERPNAMLMDSVKSEATTSNIQLPRPAVLCKICEISKMTMYYLTCGHIAKLYNVSSYLPICNNCSQSLPQCTRCMTSNRHQSDDDSFWMNM